MNSGYVLFWIVFSFVVGVLYYFIIAENAFKTKIIRGFSKLWDVFKRLPAWIRRINATVFEDDWSPERNESTVHLEEVREKWQWFEWIVIIIPIWVYCLPFLDLGSSLNLPGSETESFQAFDQILVFSIKKHGQFPLWNPYFFTGMPYVAHPMLHAYNPFVSIPVLLFGVLDGFKIAVFLGFIVAGLGMWWLGKEAGLGPAARIWVSFMYVFSGVPAAKFIQGQYLMVLAFGWIPFSLAAILAATRYKRRKYICVAAIGLALLFFSGNVYYAYYMLYVIAIYAAISIFRLTKNPIKLKVNRGKIKILAAIGALSLGLIAIQLLPLVEYRDQFFKTVDTDLGNSRSIQNIFLDFVSPEPFRPGAFSDSLRPEEFYAYVGWWPLIGMLFLPLAWGEKKKRTIMLFLALIVFTFIWIDVKDMPWRGLFKTIPLLSQFRYPSRMVAVGAMALVAAGGLGLDGLLKKFGDVELRNNQQRLKNISLNLAVGIFMVWSVYNLAFTSRPLLQTVSYYQEPRIEMMAWLRKFDPGIYYVNMPENWHRAVIENEMRYQNIWDSITVIPNFENQISERLIEAGPKYLVLLKEAIPPKNAVLIKTFDTINIYRMTNSLPFVFTLDTSILTTPINRNLAISEVTPMTSFTANVNEIEGVVESDSKKALIVLSSFSPGWQLTIDGKPTKIYNASRYMAAKVDPGIHHYLFIYQPFWFFVGLITTLATLLIILWILVAGAIEESIISK
jgi:hypothetical protein